MNDKEYRIILNEISTMSMLIPFILWGVYGYFNIYAILVESFFILFSFIFLFLSSINAKIKIHENYGSLLRYLILLLPVLLVVNLLKNIYLKIIIIIFVIAILLVIRHYYDKNNYKILDKFIRSFLYYIGGI